MKKYKLETYSNRGFLNYLYERLKDVNTLRLRKEPISMARQIFLNGLREILLEIIKDLENDNSSNKANSNN